MEKIETEWLKMRLAAYKINPPIEGSVGEGIMWALDELLAFREGYDPQEREPELGQWVVVEDIGLTTPDSPGKYVMRWTDTPDCVRWEWEDTEEEGDVEPQVFYVDMGVTWTYRTKSEVKRWYPMVGGGR